MIAFANVNLRTKNNAIEIKYNKKYNILVMRKNKNKNKKLLFKMSNLASQSIWSVNPVFKKQAFYKVIKWVEIFFKE